MRLNDEPNVDWLRDYEYPDAIMDHLLARGASVGDAWAVQEALRAHTFTADGREATLRDIPEELLPLKSTWGPDPWRSFL